MSQPTIRRTTRFLVGSAAAIGILVGAGIGPSHADTTPQTSERIVLAGTIVLTAEICSDWTNPDGTWGTNCPLKKLKHPLPPQEWP
jgi:hypothetical protein